MVRGAKKYVRIGRKDNKNNFSLYKDKTCSCLLKLTEILQDLLFTLNHGSLGDLDPNLSPYFMVNSITLLKNVFDDYSTILLLPKVSELTNSYKIWVKFIKKIDFTGA